jgi:tetratricopeptide (TPR) repeat protein
VSHGLLMVRVAGFGLLLLASMTLAAESKTGWSEVKSPHVTVKTDLGLDAAERAAVLAEKTRSQLLAAAWGGAKLPQERIELVVFADHQDFEHYFGDFVAHKVGVGDYPPTVFLYGAPERWEKRSSAELQETTSVLKLALAQHLASFFFRRQPRWFSVGLAEFFETLRVSDDGTRATMAAINPQAMGNYVTHRAVTVAEALAWGSTLNPHDEPTLLGLHGLSWLMVQWMYNTHQPEFVRFQKLLVSGMDPTKAWNLVLPKEVTDNIDRELNHFAQYGPFGMATVALPEGDFTFDSERPMTSAEVHVIRAEAALAAERPKEVQTELSAALADDPGNVAALRRQMALVKPEERLALARRATAAHPNDGLAWLILGDALKEGAETSDERMQAYQRAVQLSPDHPLVSNALASMDIQKGKPQEALPLALIAVRMAPWDAVLLDTLSAALAGVGRCSEAVAMQARAMDRAAENGSATQRAAYATRLTDIQKSCTEASPAPVAPEVPAPPAVPAAPAAPSPIPPRR